jgi:hypothetical protein
MSRALKILDLETRHPVPFVPVSPCRALLTPIGAAILTCLALWPSSCIGIDCPLALDADAHFSIAGDRLKRLDELGIICRFVIGHR